MAGARDGRRRAARSRPEHAQLPGFAGVGDEGIYTSQAWAILREGRLAPYTYFYDHAPGGWILLAAWMLVTGGVHTFGGAIDSGRVLMLLLHVAMVPMLYRVARKLGCRPPAAALATFLFSVSPLATYYQRFVLLDSFMMFWTLLSLDLLLDGWGRLSRLVLSGLCFGMAVLSKETALFLFRPCCSSSGSSAGGTRAASPSAPGWCRWRSW